MKPTIRQLSLLLISIMLLSVFSNEASEPDKKKTRKTKKEITKTDITKYKDITAEEILIFGIHLDMSKEDVERIIERRDDVYLTKDPFNENRFYLFDTKKFNNKDISLAYFIWEDDNVSKGLSEIILYFGFSRYMVGDSKNLLTMEAINKNSEIVRQFIGYPTKKETNLDLPTLGVKSFSYYYPGRNFKINRYISDSGTSISFSIFQGN